MVKKWNFDNLYASTESDEFLRDLNEARERSIEIKKAADALATSGEGAAVKIEGFLMLIDKFNDLCSTLQNYLQLISLRDVNNRDIFPAIGEIEAVASEAAKPIIKFQKWLASLENIDDIISSSEYLREHDFYIKSNIKKAEHTLDDSQENIISCMSNTGSAAWNQLHNTLLNNLRYEMVLDGEKKQLLSHEINRFDTGSKLVRERIYRAKQNGYKSIEESCAACINGVKGEVITAANARGFMSPLDMALKDFRINRETLEIMYSVLRDNLHLFRAYYKRKAELLNYENGLPIYELNTPVGKTNMKFSYNDAIKFIKENVQNFNKRMADFAENIFQRGWIDADPDENKSNLILTLTLDSIRESRILTSFYGGLNDVTALAHEIGHAYHFNLLFDEDILNREYTPPISETASIFCETLVMNAAIDRASGNEALIILENYISKMSHLLVNNYIAFLFEERLFKLREEYSPSAEKLNKLMEDIQKEVYGNSIGPDILNPYLWVTNPLYYYGLHNFYNFPYSFGLLLSKGLYAEYLKRGNAFAVDYEVFLKSAGKGSVEDIVSILGIDLKDEKFWRDAMKVIEYDISRFTTGDIY